VPAQAGWFGAGEPLT
jgi:hypothetical protein